MLNKFKTWNRRRVDERRVNKLWQYIRGNVVDDGKDEVIRFLNTNKKLAMLPYLWTNEYDKNDVVEWDDEKNYIMPCGMVKNVLEKRCAQGKGTRVC